jgi:hypothetical protein
MAPCGGGFGRDLPTEGGLMPLVEEGLLVENEDRDKERRVASAVNLSSTRRRRLPLRLSST